MYLNISKQPASDINPSSVVQQVYQWYTCYMEVITKFNLTQVTRDKILTQQHSASQSAEHACLFIPCTVLKEKMIHQNFYQPVIRDAVKTKAKICDNYQYTKKSTKRHGKRTSMQPTLCNKNNVKILQIPEKCSE